MPFPIHDTDSKWASSHTLTLCQSVTSVTKSEKGIGLWMLFIC